MKKKISKKQRQKIQKIKDKNLLNEIVEFLENEWFYNGVRYTDEDIKKLSKELFKEIKFNKVRLF